MKQLKTILLGTDFSPSSEEAVLYGIEIAKVFDSKIIVIHVIPEGLAKEHPKSELENEAWKRLYEVNEQVEEAGVKTGKPILEIGNVEDQVVRAANQLEANLLLIGSGMNAKDQSYKLGITATRIMRKSNKPVWVAKWKHPFRIKTIFCPVDFSDESKRALQNALLLTKSFDARLIVFSVYELYSRSWPRFSGSSGGMNNLVRKEHERRLGAFLSQFNFSDIDWEPEVGSGDPSTEISSALARSKADLLIMGTTGKSGWSRMLIGSVTEKVTRKLPCAFTTLKAESILSQELQMRSHDVEHHYNKGKELMKKGLYQDSIAQYMICLQINDMHIPSLIGLSEANKRLGNMESAETYKKIAHDTLAKIWDGELEGEIFDLQDA